MATVQHQSMTSTSPECLVDGDGEIPKSASPTALNNKPFYFGYGSNLWLDQMRRRCPGSTYHGLGILKGWKWIINDRGYANIIPSPGDLVYGMIYELTDEDENILDACEGVPSIYVKQVDQVEFYKQGAAGGKKGERIEVLVYVDVERVSDGDPEEEYIYRMNMAIRDALREGMPQWYVEKYIRKSIPEEEFPEDHVHTDVFLEDAVKEGAINN